MGPRRFSICGLKIIYSRRSNKREILFIFYLGCTRFYVESENLHTWNYIKLVEIGLKECEEEERLWRVHMVRRMKQETRRKGAIFPSRS